jgi:hypothetical protein
MINRRRFMTGAALAGAGAVGAVVLTGHSPIELPSAEAAPGDQRFRYRGRDVQITRLPDSAHVLVDGRHGVHLERDGNAYLTHLLPFSTFADPRQAAVALIDGAADTLFIL